MRLVIVGAGPCGTCLAVALARSGQPVTLVEAASEPVAESMRRFRGEALMPSGLEALERLGLWPLPAQVPQRALGGWQIAVEGHQLVKVDEPLGGPRAAPCTLVNQPALLAALLEPPQRPPALRVAMGSAAADLLRDSNSRVCGVVLADGRELPADLVVGCDGRASLLRRRAGLALMGEQRPVDVLWFRFPQAAGPLPDPGFITVAGPAGLASLFSNARGQVQLGWAIAPDAPTPSLGRSQWTERLAAQAPPHLAGWLQRNAAQLEGPQRFSVQVGMAERWWQPGLLLLGDAAHPMSPVRAQGLNMALRDAAVASAVLSSRATAAASATAIDALLAVIEANRRPEVERLQQLQAEELARGTALQARPWLRQLLAGLAPLVGPAVSAVWRRQQRPLRHGLAPLPARR